MPQERNRLVKRTTSQRHINGDAATKVPTLRRPATSHQRSAELESWNRAQERQSMSITPDLLPQSRVVPTPDARWKSFFTVKVNKKTSGSKNSDAPSQNFRRIVPDEGYYPTLVSTKAIVTSDLDVNEYPEYDTDSVFFSSRPPSAFGLDQALAQKRLSTAVEPHTTASDPVAQPPQNDGTDREASPRRSFTSLLSRKPSRRGSIRGAVASKLSKRMGRRVVSEPSTIAASKHQTFASDSDSFAEANHHQGVPRSAQANVTGRTDNNSPLISHASTTPTLNDQYSPHVAQHNHFADASLVNNYDTTASRPRNSYAPSETASSTAETDTWMEEYESGAATHGHYAIMSNGRPRTSRTSRSRRGSEPRFETIPDESPPKQSTPQLRNVLPTGMGMGVTDTIEEESHMGSPSRTIRSDRADNGSPFVSRTANRSPLPLSPHMPSSPPEFAKPLNLGSLEYDDRDVSDEDEESRWDEQESMKQPSEVEDWDLEEQVATPVPLRRSSPFHVDLSSGSRISTYSSDEQNLRNGTKSTLFSYSEKATDKPSGNSSPPRPKTVHGKKDADGRGSRSNKRRMPGGLHIRSQSVPVVPDLAGKRQAVITNKFGTWGVGSKGVTEDWDEDFDFGDKAHAPAANGHEEKRTDSMQPMTIPQKIKEHQISVMNNISLVREFGLMIEELKTLKPRAASLGLIEQASDDLYELVDSMIELADQEAEVPNAHASPPSSPGLDMSGFDEPPVARTAKKTGRNVSSGDRHDTVIRTPPATKIKRKTVLPDENDVFTSPATQADLSKPSTPLQHETMSRPRKDSEAMARSVIEALKNKKSDVEASVSLQPVPVARRVQFDTRTLRHIVPYVSSLVRRVKEQIREAENFDMDSESDWDADIEPRVPPLAHVFKDPSPIPESPSSRKSRSTPKVGTPPIDDVSKKLKMMTVM